MYTAARAKRKAPGGAIVPSHYACSHWHYRRGLADGLDMVEQRPSMERAAEPAMREEPARPMAYGLLLYLS